MLGAGMRQAGILAAGAIYALEHHRSRLSDDHENARLFAGELRSVIEGTTATVQEPETNIVNIDLKATEGTKVIALAKADGVLVGAILPTRLRAVFHLDVGSSDAVHGARLLGRAIQTACGAT
jgi:threonine aldolase